MEETEEEIDQGEQMGGRECERKKGEGRGDESGEKLGVKCEENG